MPVSSRAMARYVLIRPGALGDVLLAFPALAQLRRAWPEAHVTLIARSDVLALARSSGLADAVFIYDDPAWSVLFTAEPPAIGEAREVIAGSAVVAWLADSDDLVSRNLAHLGAVQVVVAPGRPPPGEREHVALRLARSLAPLGIAPPAKLDELALPLLSPTPVDDDRAESVWHALGLPRDMPLVALHPGSGAAAKRWPPEYFAALAAGLQDAGMQPLLIEGPQDAEITARIVAIRVHGALPVVRGLNIGALAALLRRCAGYVGNDSGVSHLAGLAGAPTLALFGPSDPMPWAPLGPTVRVLRSPSRQMADLRPSQVCETLLALV